MNIVIFGGAGFIGQHYARHLRGLHPQAQITLVDIKSPAAPILDMDDAISVVMHDVRQPIPPGLLPQSCDLVCNFAAVHREPGHELREYYETNLPGAENVCAWATEVGCKQLLFTSSIAPYGPSEDEKTERSIPTPETAYGGSKLAAEKIHQVWQASGAGRRLAIIRPGVVFGPYEGGNVSRLIRGVLRRYMVYTGNQEVRKAGIYVKELCRIFDWALDHAAANDVVLANASMNPGPSVEEYVDAICEVAGVRRRLPNIPFSLVYLAGTIVELFAKLVRFSQPIDRVRLRKLVRSNNILPAYLVENGYEYHYSLMSALADWKQDAPEEWR